MKLGIIGLPNVGKSTLFNAITECTAECANYPFCTIEPNVGSVPVADERLDTLAKMYSTKKVIPSLLEFVDIAGLVKGASKGEGLGNKFLANIREVDAMLHVVRCFDDSNITHIDSTVDPVRDIETINTELILADIESANKRLDKAQKACKGGDKNSALECDVLQELLSGLNSGHFCMEVAKNFDEAKKAILKSFFFITAKPVIYCCNVAEFEKDLHQNSFVSSVAEYAKIKGAETASISAKLEYEIAQLPKQERQSFIAELGLGESGLSRIVKCGYKTLGLISFLTAGEKEVHSWTIKKGTKAPQAAGEIHSDFERGFIRAEVVSYDDLCLYGSIVSCKNNGKYRSEGKDYVVKDGDVMLFRFNV
ncbi:MAG: redox-regulated ATPase YchF [Clostridiales bacterium]|jgi:GTP-binding protein YchF|nr:redox-regulated ATPase YchF [Clostridiales bacterium]